jgi:hypothetical protein
MNDTTLLNTNTTEGAMEYFEIKISDFNRAILAADQVDSFLAWRDSNGFPAPVSVRPAAGIARIDTAHVSSYIGDDGVGVCVWTVTPPVYPNRS